MSGLSEELLRAQQADVGKALRKSAREMIDHSGSQSAASSGTAERRETLSEGERIQVELERRSNCSDRQTGRKHNGNNDEISSEVGSAASSCQHSDHPRGSGSAEAAHSGSSGNGRHSSSSPASGSGEPSGQQQSHTQCIHLMDKVERAILESKRMNMQQKAGSNVSGGTDSNIDSTSGSGSMHSRPNNTTTVDSSANQSGPSSSTMIPTSMLNNLVATVNVQGVPVPLSVAHLIPASLVEGLSEVDLHTVEMMLQKIVSKTGSELADMQLAMDRQKAVNASSELDQEELRTELLKARLRANNSDSLQASLTLSREAVWAAQNERDDLQDKLAGMEARLNAKIANHAASVALLQGEKDALSQELKSQVEREASQDHKRLKEELLVATEAVEKASKLKFMANSERDILQRAEQIAAKAHEAELKMLRSELMAARRENDRKDEELTGLDRLPSAHFDDHRLLEENLRESRESNMKLSADLTDLRLEMLQVHRLKEEELADWKARAESGQMNQNQRLLQQKGRTPKKIAAKPSQLAIIDEDDGEDIASQAASGISGQVSEPGIGDLSELGDYDDNGKITASEEAKDKELKRLGLELSNTQDWFKNLQDEGFVKDAEHAAKVERITKQMQAFREEAIISRNEIQRLEMITEENDAEKSAQLLAVRAQLAKAGTIERMTELEENARVLASDLEEVRQQLLYAVEAKRLMGIRLADTQREMEAMEKRHARVVEDLQQRLELASASDPDSAERAEHSVLGRLQSVEEDRNILRNELECERVHYQVQLETERQQLTLAAAKLREEEAMAAKDRQLKDQVEQSLKEKQHQLIAARNQLKETDEKLQQQVAKSRQGGFILGALRCPMRGAATAAGQPGEAQCQAVIWQIVSAMRGVTAILCTQGSFSISDASRKAFTLWGSSALRGSSMLGLVYDAATASWMENVLTAPSPGIGNQGLAPGFWMRELGCIEFRSKLGSAFDSNVTVAGLPEEITGNRPAALIVIVEPLEKEDQQRGGPPNPPPPTGRRHRVGPPSVASSVHSEDITANDSVSNVNARW